MGGTALRKEMGRIVALLAALIMATALGGLAFAPAAQADTVSQFNVSADVEGNVSAYRVFTADIDATTNGASNVAWNTDYQGAVLAFLDGSAADTGASVTYGRWLFDNDLASIDLTGRSTSAMTTADRAAHDSADNAMAYIAEQISSSAGVSRGGTLITTDGSFSNNLANAVKAVGSVTATAEISGSTTTFVDLEEGFYLFSHESSMPVWAPVGGATDTVALKTDSILAISKKVFDAVENDYVKLTDAGIGELVTFRVIGDLPNSVPNAGTQYVYKLVDTLPAGLAFESGSLHVYVADENGTQGAELTNVFGVSSESPLTIETEDLYSAANRTNTGITTAKKLIFDYQVRVTGSATLGTTYNTNSVVLTYGKKDDELVTQPDEANVATYELDIVKVSSEDGSNLEGAKFTVKKGEQYLQADGTLGNNEYVFETDSSGAIKVQRIDDGTYTVKETEAPAGYQLPSVDTTEVNIVADKDVVAGELNDLTATATNGVEVTADVATGVVSITLENDPATILPITGMTPNQLGTAVGILLVVAGGIALLLRSRRQKAGRA